MTFFAAIPQANIVAPQSSETLTIIKIHLTKSNNVNWRAPVPCRVTREAELPMLNVVQLISIQGALRGRELRLCSQLRSAIIETFGGDLPGFVSNVPYRLYTAKSIFDDDKSGVVRRNINELMAIESAREAIKNGYYGVCEACHGEIEFSRLLVLPATTHCRECQKLMNDPAAHPLKARS